MDDTKRFYDAYEAYKTCTDNNNNCINYNKICTFPEFKEICKNMEERAKIFEENQTKIQQDVK